MALDYHGIELSEKSREWIREDLETFLEGRYRGLCRHFILTFVKGHNGTSYLGGNIP